MEGPPHPFNPVRSRRSARRNRRHAALFNKSLEQNALNASCELLASHQPARRIAGIAQFWRCYE